MVQQLVAVGAIKGEVLDPGTGPGHHAIYYASKGYSATGIDGSAAAIERAQENARKAGVAVNFEVADATKLEGLDDRFDTVVDCAFYHTFSTAPELQKSYVQALRRATKPGARLYMFEFGEHDVNGFRMFRSLSENDFREVLPLGGFEITYLGTTTYQVNISAESIEMMADTQSRCRRASDGATETVPGDGAVAGQRQAARAVLGSARHPDRLRRAPVAPGVECEPRRVNWRVVRDA